MKINLEIVCSQITSSIQTKRFRLPTKGKKKCIACSKKYKSFTHFKIINYFKWDESGPRVWKCNNKSIFKKSSGVPRHIQDMDKMIKNVCFYWFWKFWAIYDITNAVSLRWISKLDKNKFSVKKSALIQADIYWNGNFYGKTYNRSMFWTRSY